MGCLGSLALLPVTMALKTAFSLVLKVVFLGIKTLLKIVLKPIGFIIGIPKRLAFEIHLDVAAGVDCAKCQ